MKRKIGRPSIPRGKALGRTYGARFRPDEEKELILAIRASGKSKSDWIRDALLAEARAGTGQSGGTPGRSRG